MLSNQIKTIVRNKMIERNLKPKQLYLMIGKACSISVIYALYNGNSYVYKPYFETLLPIFKALDIEIKDFNL